MYQLLEEIKTAHHHQTGINFTVTNIANVSKQISLSNIEIQHGKRML